LPTLFPPNSIKIDIVMATIQPPLWMAIFCCSVMFSLYLIKWWLNTHSIAHWLSSLIPLNPVELLRQPAHPQLHQTSMTAFPRNSCFIASLIFQVRNFLLHFFPGDRMVNRKAKMFSSIVKGLRDEKLGELVDNSTWCWEISKYLIFM
jgi:hypothetical protein